jgi:protein involved in polysaccharide export with SLBB domain
MQESIGINLARILSNPSGPDDLILKEGDVLSIPRQLQTVRVRGEVLYPSTVLFIEGDGLKSFISQTGGFTNRAQKRKVYVVYANGSAQKTGSFLGIKNYPNVQPGAEVIIPKKPERRKIGPGEVLGVTSGLASLSLVMIQIINLTR